MFKGLFEESCSIGSTGFAQVGTNDYWEKQKFEGKWLLTYFENNFIFPDGIFLAWTSHPHDFGTYHELTIYYSAKFKTEKEIDTDWKFINQVEDIDLDVLEEKINEDWLMLKSIEAIEKDDGSHLNLVG